MRAGVLDFLQKTFYDDELIQRVNRVLEQDTRERRSAAPARGTARALKRADPA
jgi:FixJ family two-component response regulator